MQHLIEIFFYICAKELCLYFLYKQNNYNKVRHIANFIGHLQAAIKRNGVFGVFFNYVSSVDGVVCVLSFPLELV